MLREALLAVLLVLGLAHSMPHRKRALGRWMEVRRRDLRDAMSYPYEDILPSHKYSLLEVQNGVAQLMQMRNLDSSYDRDTSFQRMRSLDSSYHRDTSFQRMRNLDSSYDRDTSFQQLLLKRRPSVARLVKKGMKLNCDTTRITIQTILEYLRSGRICGFRVTTVRFGLGGRR